MYWTLLAEKFTNAIQNVKILMNCYLTLQEWQQFPHTWSEHIVTVFLARQITIKNVQIQLTVKGKTTTDSYTPTPKSSCAQTVVVLK
jgi:hypothetical protein